MLEKQSGRDRNLDSHRMVKQHLYSAAANKNVALRTTRDQSQLLLLSVACRCTSEYDHTSPTFRIYTVSTQVVQRQPSKSTAKKNKLQSTPISHRHYRTPGP